MKTRQTTAKPNPGARIRPAAARALALLCAMALWLGTLAGAASNLYEDLKRAVSFGIPVREAVRAATLTPAGVIGMEGEIGSLDAGKRADFLVCGPDLELKQVYVWGCILRKNAAER